jgi:hypothetical protein
LVIPVLAAPVRRYVAFLGLVNSHKTSPPPGGAKRKSCSTQRAFRIED